MKETIASQHDWDGNRTSLTKNLVELHEGTISVESETGQGAEFIVCIPIDRSYFREDQIDDEAIVPIQKM